MLGIDRKPDGQWTRTVNLKWMTDDSFSLTACMVSFITKLDRSVSTA